MGKGLTIALLASLALNVFLAGIFAGRLLSPERPAPPPHVEAPAGDNPRVMARFARDLPPASRRAFRRALRDSMPDLREQQSEFRSLRRTYYEALNAEDWDRETAEAALTAMQQARDERRALIDQAFLDAFETLSPEERALLLEQIRSQQTKRDKPRR